MQTQLPLQQTLHMEPDQDDPAWLCSDEFRMYALVCCSAGHLPWNLTCKHSACKLHHNSSYCKWFGKQKLVGSPVDLRAWSIMHAWLIAMAGECTDALLDRHTLY
jgi:hypothetical protein